MNKKIKILIVGLVLLIGNRVKDQGDWDTFKTVVERGGDEVINLSDYIDGQNKLIWQEYYLIVGGNKTFVGLRGNNFAILDGNVENYVFGINNKAISFSGNFEFRHSIGAISVSNMSSIDFADMSVNFTSNTAIGSGGAIALTNSAANENIDESIAPEPDPDIPTPIPFYPNISQTLNSVSPFFVANTIRASAISDNVPIYSNIDEKAWGAVQINGGNLADDDLGDFKNSAVGAKAGYRVFSGGGKTAGVFAGFGSRAYKQGGNKAAASDIDFGAYGSWSAAEKVGLAGFLGYGLQAVKVEGGGSSAEFDATVIKFGAKAEYAAGLISPFLGLEGAIVNTDDVNLSGATLEAAAYTRLSSQIGAKIDKKAGKLAWFGRAYVDLLLAGAKPQYSVKPDVEGAKSQTIDGTAENAASFGLGAGGALPVSNAVDVFANADIKLGGGYFGYQMNIGAKFKF